MELERPVILGCSMGGAIVLKLAAEYQNELRGVVGLETSAYAPGRYNEYLHHPAIHGGELVASYTYGLCAPMSPGAERRGRTGGTTASRGRASMPATCTTTALTGTAAKTPGASTPACASVSLLTGEYDYSCTPDMTRAVAASIPGSRMVIMDGMGHFPMIENYPVFRGFLLPELEWMAS